MLNSDAQRLSNAFAAAMSTREIVAIDALLHPEATFWHNHDGITLDRSTALDGMRVFFEATSHCGYAEIRITETAYGYVEQHITEMRFGDDGPLYRVPCCLVITIRDGLILSIEEYLDTRIFSS